MKALFVCSMGKMRSRTAAVVCSKYFDSVDFCGIDIKHPDIYRKIEPEMCNVQFIFCFENRHKKFLIKHMKIEPSKIIMLNIPDNYYYLEDELCHLIEIKVTKFLENKNLLDNIWKY